MVLSCYMPSPSRNHHQEYHHHYHHHNQQQHKGRRMHQKANARNNRNVRLVPMFTTAISFIVFLACFLPTITIHSAFTILNTQNNNNDCYYTRRHSSFTIQRMVIDSKDTENDLNNNNNSNENENNDSSSEGGDDFSTWIVSNLKGWPLLNMNMNNDIDYQKQEDVERTSIIPSTSTTTTATTAATSTVASNNNSTIWNDVFGELIKSTISTTTSIQNAADISSYLRSSFFQVGTSFDTNTSTTAPKGIELPTIPSTITDSIIKQATNRIEAIVTDASNAVSSDKTVIALINKASELVRQSTSTSITTTTPAITESLLNTTASSTISSSSSSSSTKPAIGIEPSDEKRSATYTSTSTSNTNTNVNTVTTYAFSILRIADGLLRKGYVDSKKQQQLIMQQQSKNRRQSDTSVSGSSSSINESLLRDIPTIVDSNSLFHEYESARELDVVSKSSSSMLSETFLKTVEMGSLAGAIYEDTIPRTHSLQHTIVGRGTSADVTWMISDSIDNTTSYTSLISSSSPNRDKWGYDNNPESILVRTITIRGYDASDESVDREQLLNEICTATPVSLWTDALITGGTNTDISQKGQQQPSQLQKQQQLQGILVHSGLLRIARAVYSDVKQYIDWTASSHKIVLNGHSIGGSVTVLILLLMIQDYGIEFVQKKVIQVYTFGSPPVTVTRNPNDDVLSTLGLPNTFVKGYVQPWDPIVRLFTKIDALYPLASDLGPDNNTPFANGPPRTLRPILKTILVSWAGWPRFRDNYKYTANQNYTAIGVQHILLPEPTRYLADRFLAVNIPVPPIETIVQISSTELYSALATNFPLDVFEVSYIPQAIRSFVHHFYPAYGTPFVDYVKEIQRRASIQQQQQQQQQQSKGPGGSGGITTTMTPTIGTISSDRNNDDNTNSWATQYSTITNNSADTAGRTSNRTDGTSAKNSTSTTTNDGRIDWGKATQWLTTRYDTSRT